jgi:hypothetical protein
MEIKEGRGSLEYLTGLAIESPLPRRLAAVRDELKKTHDGKTGDISSSHI